MKWTAKEYAKYKYYCDYLKRHYPSLPQSIIENNAAKMVKHHE